MTRKHTRLLRYLSAALLVLACDDTAPRSLSDTVSSDEPSPLFRNVETATAYVGDEVCTACHEEAAAAYQGHNMARSFHRWTPDTRIETPLVEPIVHAPTGFHYAVVEEDGYLYQEEYLIGPEGRRLHELRRRIDFVMGSGNVARTYFTEENGRLFQLPLTWYHQQGWDFSPGYEVNNARFDRLMPDRCIACHGSYPTPIPFLEGKYRDLPPGIGCERCHGPGALHADERSTGSAPDSTYDTTIVNPKHLPFDRRLDVCDQCHVHTPVTVLREGRDAFSYIPSLRLSDHAAYFKLTGSIDIVSHADRLRQSACFMATRGTEQPLECATCHNPHVDPADRGSPNQPCQTCHASADLEERLKSSTALPDHTTTSNCVDCHMPRVKERTVPHGSFTEHWIRVVTPGSAPPQGPRTSDRPVEPYFERDRTGPDAEVYQGMGEVVYATLAPDARALSNGAAALGRALEADTTRGDAHFMLGLAYQLLGRTDDAIRALERSMHAAPDRPQRLHALAQVYERAGREPYAVDSLYQQALALQPALAWIRADYADFLQGQGRIDDAEEAYRAALSEQPSLAVAHFNLGTLLTGLGRLGAATESFQEAVRLNPSLAEALATLLQIQTTGSIVTGVRILGSPLTSVAVRYRGPNAVQLTVAARTAESAVLFVKVPRRGSVRVLDSGGRLVRAVPTQEGPIWSWDLLTAAGNPIAGGLYYVEVRGEDGSGNPVPPQRFAFGVVHVRD